MKKKERAGTETIYGRSYLQVPFADKDLAKRLGARWDGITKRWYIVAGVDPSPFMRWMTAAQVRPTRSRVVAALAKWARA